RARPPAPPFPYTTLFRSRAPVSVGRQQDFRVAARPEAIPGGPQLVAQLDVVVDLAIEDDDELAILRAHRLVASGAQVQGGEPAKDRKSTRLNSSHQIISY